MPPSAKLRRVTSGVLLSLVMPWLSLCVPAFGRELDTELAITKPEILRELDKRFGIGPMLVDNYKDQMDNKVLFGLPSMKGVIEATERDLSAYEEGRSTGRPFNKKYLHTGFARFVLAGIVNRMDRAWADEEDPGSCGEVRLIYRLVYSVELELKPNTFIASYLPMTLNLVLRTRNQQDLLSCKELASRWLRLDDNAVNVSDLASADGVLALVNRSHVERIEINMQAARWAAGDDGTNDFGGRADYLLKLFKLNTTSQVFEESTLENHVDRDLLLANGDLVTKLRQFLLDADNLSKLDSGTLKIPRDYLAKKAISVAPGGALRSVNRPLSNFVNARSPGVTEAINKAVATGGLTTIRSTFGFERRLDDISCVGCHQTHAVGGFHFMGIDWNNAHPTNTVTVAASPHFFGEMPRRRAIVEAFAAGTKPDYSRGFAGRPLPRQSVGLEGTGLYNGWGAHCYVGGDPSFTSWRCAKDLGCKVLTTSSSVPGFGLCLPEGRRQVGDPVEIGDVKGAAFDSERYSRRFPSQVTSKAAKMKKSWMLDHFRKELRLPPEQIASHQEFDRTDATGGFPGGMLRLVGVDNTCPQIARYPEAICARVAGDGFNDCITEQKGNFEACFEKNTVPAGLRWCDKSNPCREDYICVATPDDKTRGACLPPYFMFQFRVDGHPPNPQQ